MDQESSKYKKIVYFQYALGIVFLVFAAYGAFGMRSMNASLQEKVGALEKEQAEILKKTQIQEQTGVVDEKSAIPAEFSDDGYGCKAGEAFVKIGESNGCQPFWKSLHDLPLSFPAEGDDSHLVTAGGIFDWVNDLDLMRAGDSIKKSQLADKGELDFKWEDSEIENDLEIDEDGEVGWLALDGYPSGCPAGYAVQTIGDTLTCVDLPSGDSLFTDGGDVTYLTSQTDIFALGGLDDTAPFYFDTNTGQLVLNSLKVGGATDNVEISSDGTFLLNGDATVWDDLKIPVTSTKNGGSKDPDLVVFKTDGSGSQGVFTYNFDAGIEEEVYFTVQLPHSHKPGSDIHPHVHWSPTDAGSGDVVWSIEYTWTNINSTFGDSVIIEAADAADGTADKHQVFSLAAIDGTGKHESSMLICRIFRKAADDADTYAADASLLEIDFHYEVEKLGTVDEF